MRAEIPFGQREFFLKSSRPSFLIKRAALGNLKASFHCTHWHRFFPLKKAPPLISVFFNGLYTPFGSPVSGGQKPSLSLRKAPPLTPALFNGLYTPFGSPVCGGQKPQERGRKPPSSARNRCAIRLSDHQRSTPYCAGWDRRGILAN